MIECADPGVSEGVAADDYCPDDTDLITESIISDPDALDDNRSASKPINTLLPSAPASVIYAAPGDAAGKVERVFACSTIDTL